MIWKADWGQLEVENVDRRLEFGCQMGLYGYFMARGVYFALDFMINKLEIEQFIMNNFKQIQWKVLNLSLIVASFLKL